MNCYGLHIVLRYELELALLEQGLPVAELPERWNQRFAELLGQRPDSDSNGCLQDIHWAEGLFGYFPSYALGHLISAQLNEAMQRDLGSLPELIAAGQEQQLRQWLAARVWPLGRSVNGEQLVQQVSGEPLSAAPFLRYLEEKSSACSVLSLGELMQGAVIQPIDRIALGLLQQLQDSLQS